MVQDYANRQSGKPRKKRWWIIILIVFVLAFASLAMLVDKYKTIRAHAKATSVTQKTRQEKLVTEIKKARLRTQQRLNEQSSHTPKKKSPFNFYTMLPKMTVSVPKASPIKPGKQYNYQLQFASLKTMSQAKSLRDKLVKYGVAASIAVQKISGVAWFAVQSPVYQTQTKAITVQDSLREVDIDSLMLQLNPMKPVS